MFLRKGIIGAMDREVEIHHSMDKFIFPLTHFITSPTHHGIIVNRKSFVRDHQIGIDAKHFSKAFADRASTYRIVEAKHHIRRFFKLDTIRLKFVGIIESFCFFVHIETNSTFPLSFIESSFYGFRKTANIGRIRVASQTVNHQTNFFGFDISFFIFQQIIDQ